MSNGFTPQQATLFRSAGPYPVEAYAFVRDGLSHTAGHVHAQADHYFGMNRHVSGQELCMGLRDFAIQRYGLLARMVLECWCIHRTEDFGRMVFAMIEAELFKQQPDDSMADFVSVYDFREAFDLRDIELRIGEPTPG